MEYRPARNAMMTKRISKPMELAIGDELMRFTSAQEFQFSLNGRTSVPSHKMSALMRLSPKEIKAEASTIDDLEKRFQAILDRAVGDPGSIGVAIQKLELAIFSQDHGWRSIISGLKDCGDEYNEFKFIALQKYMQYLNSRKTILKDLYTSKLAPAEEDRLSGTASLDSTMFVPVRDLKQSVRQIPRKATPVTRRLPKGEPVIIRLETGEVIELKLSKHIYRISCSAGIELIDQEGQHYMLAKGRNMVGRDADCDICLDTSMKDISRKHLIIDNLGDNRLKLTDLSSHGTSITQ